MLIYFCVCVYHIVKENLKIKKKDPKMIRKHFDIVSEQVKKILQMMQYLYVSPSSLLEKGLINYPNR